MKRFNIILQLCLLLHLPAIGVTWDSAYYKEAISEYDYSEDSREISSDSIISPVEFKSINELEEHDWSLPEKELKEESDGWGLTVGIIAGVLLLIGFLMWRYQNAQANLKTVELEAATSVEHAEKDLLNVSLDNLIENAEKSEDLRALIHLHFLQLLRALHIQNKINWVPYKTNGQYLYEIESDEIRQSYFEIVSVFDRVWYGYKHIDTENYTKWLNEVNKWVR